MNLLAKINNLIKRGATTAIVNHNTQFPRVQVKYFNKTAEVELLTPYGFDGSAPVGSFATIFNVMGNEENRTAIVHDHPRAPKDLEPTEVSMSNYTTKARIRMLENGDISIYGPKDQIIKIDGNNNVTIQGNETVTVEGGLVQYNVDLFKIQGSLEVTEGVIWDTANGAKQLNLFVDTFNTHDHNENDSGGPTDPPNQGFP